MNSGYLEMKWGWVYTKGSRLLTNNYKVHNYPQRYPQFDKLFINKK